MGEVTHEDWEEAVNVHALIHVARLISEYEGSDFDDVLDELYDRIGAE